MRNKQTLAMTRFDVYETLCPQQMHVNEGGQIKNWVGNVETSHLQCQNIQRALQVFYHEYKFSKSKSETADNTKNK